MSMFYELMMKKKGMPSRYQEVEYIESTGTQYIDTGLVPKATFKYKIKYSLNAVGNVTLFGSRTSGAYNTSRNQNYLNSYSVSGSKRTILVNLYNTNDVNLNIDPAINDVVETPLMQNENCVIENATQSLYLFCFNIAGTPSGFTNTKMYYFQIYDNNRLVRNFIPVYDTLTQKYGMWESVQGKFYGNAGTGDFKGSIVGYTVVGSPTITDGVVSGFSASDFIYISNFPYTKNWSITIKASTTATGATQRCLYRSVNFQLRVNTINIWEIYASGVNKSLGQSSASYPYVRVEKENGYISAYISQDGITYSKVVENIDAGSVTDGSLSFSSSGDIWSGSIDMNETIIFVNNKLYFNGQQA